MDILYKELQERFILSIKSFLDDKITTEELIKNAKEFDLLFKINDEKYLERMKKEIFEFYKSEYQMVLETDRVYRKHKEGIVIDVDVDALIKQSRRIGSVRQPPYGIDACRKFKGPFPLQEDFNEAE